jgi:hypothetical protein
VSPNESTIESDSDSEYSSAASSDRAPRNIIGPARNESNSETSGQELSTKTRTNLQEQNYLLRVQNKTLHDIIRRQNEKIAQIANTISVTFQEFRECDFGKNDFGNSDEDDSGSQQSGHKEIRISRG